MRMLIQRVLEAKVTVDGQTTGKIGHGLLVFLAVKKGDTETSVDWMIKKLMGLRIFSDEAGKMNLSIEDVNANILVVSQFTLYGNCTQGRRPDFLDSAKPSEARLLYDAFVQKIRSKLGDVQTGRFAAKMEVSLINDGPVTFLVER